MTASFDLTSTNYRCNANCLSSQCRLNVEAMSSTTCRLSAFQLPLVGRGGHGDSCRPFWRILSCLEGRAIFQLMCYGVSLGGRSVFPSTALFAFAYQVVITLFVGLGVLIKLLQHGDLGSERSILLRSWISGRFELMSGSDGFGGG